jgi:hypothetical protein
MLLNKLKTHLPPPKKESLYAVYVFGLSQRILRDRWSKEKCHLHRIYQMCIVIIHVELPISQVLLGTGSFCTIKLRQNFAVLLQWTPYIFKPSYITKSVQLKMEIPPPRKVRVYWIRDRVNMGEWDVPKIPC